MSEKGEVYRDKLLNAADIGTPVWLGGEGLDNTLRGAAKYITELESQLAGWKQNAAFYKSCAMSGEVPTPGAEPYKEDAP